MDDIFDDPNYTVEGLPPSIKGKITQFYNAVTEYACIGTQDPEFRGDIKDALVEARYELERTIKTLLDRDDTTGGDNVVPLSSSVKSSVVNLRNTKPSDMGTSEGMTKFIRGVADDLDANAFPLEEGYEYSCLLVAVAQNNDNTFTRYAWDNVDMDTKIAITTRAQHDVLLGRD